jgi:hypothetical protein
MRKSKLRGEKRRRRGKEFFKIFEAKRGKLRIRRGGKGLKV